MPQGQRDVTPPLIAPIDVNALQEIEIDEDETVGNPDSEPEQAAECVLSHPASELSLMTFEASENLHLHL
jgi:hypothetical protein